MQNISQSIVERPSKYYYIIPKIMNFAGNEYQIVWLFLGVLTRDRRQKIATLKKTGNHNKDKIRFPGESSFLNPFKPLTWFVLQRQMYFKMKFQQYCAVAVYEFSRKAVINFSSLLSYFHNSHTIPFVNFSVYVRFYNFIV